MVCSLFQWKTLVGRMMKMTGRETLPLGKFLGILNAVELFKVSTKSCHYMHTFIIIW